MAPLKSECDICDKEITGTLYKACVTRPSDPIWLCSIMWACEDCASTIGGKPDDYWEEYAKKNNLLYEG
jgi:hypothetical protein